MAQVNGVLTVWSPAEGKAVLVGADGGVLVLKGNSRLELVGLRLKVRRRACLRGGRLIMRRISKLGV